MSEVTYTSGVWVAKDGKADEFVRTWTEFATWTKATFEGALHVVLLRDDSNPNRFISVGPWRSRDDIAKWRASEGFHTRVEQLQRLLERFEPGLYTEVFNSES